MGARLGIVLQVVLLAAGLGVLAGLNRVPAIDRLAPSSLPGLRGVWLPVLFALVYGMGWVVWWLWGTLLPDVDRHDFPEIDAAWDEAVAALDAAGVGLTDAPLFLVLGRTASGDETLFGASQLPWAVEQVPEDPAAPLHVYANEDGIYVTCAGASLLGCQSTVWGGDADLAAMIAGLDPAEAPPESSEDDAFKTLQPKGRLQEVQAVLARAAAEGRAPQNLTDGERDEIRRLIGAETDTVTGARKDAASLLKKPAEVERLSSRLQHLCKLIARDRRPYCPLNGILVVIPFTATDSDEHAATAGSLCRTDLATARAALGVYCPVLVLFSDLESTPGFREFVKRFPAEQRQRRLGQRFPLAPDLNLAETSQMILQGTEWICHSMFPNWVYKLFRLERPGGDDYGAMTAGNVELYQLMSQMRLRQKRLSQLTARAVQPDDGGPPLFGGCYIAATGADAVNDQAFVPGVFRRLLENQNYLSWTEAALDDDARQQRWAAVGYGAITLAALALVATAVVLWLRGGGSAAAS